MSASYRKISRLPISVFQDLITRPDLERLYDNPEIIKSTICDRLKRFRVKNDGRNKRKNMHGRKLGISSPTTTTCNIKTIGQLLRLSKYSLMIALDPLLTYEEIGIFLERVCNQCSSKPSSVLKLLRVTESDRNAGVCISKYEHGSNEIVPLTMFEQVQQQHQQQLCDTDPVALGNQMRQLPTSLLSLDLVLRGGIRISTITELVGRSGVGKTQLALQLCVTAAKLNQGAIYIDTEKKVSLERLKEMSEERRMFNMKKTSRRNIEKKNNRNIHSTNVTCNQSMGGRRPPQSHQETCNSYRSNNEYGNNYDHEDSIASFKAGEIVLDNLTLHQPGNSEELLDVLDELEYEILIRNQSAGSSNASEGRNITGGHRIKRKKFPVRLVIVDSIAAPIRRDFGYGSAPKRAATIFQCAQKLKRLADQLHMAVVVINQVGSGECDISRDIGTNNSCDSESSPKHQHSPVRAALGTSWHHCVSTRLLLETKTVDTFVPQFRSFNNDNHIESSFRNTVQSAHNSVRKITVTKSNRTGFGESYFNITSMGIVEI